MSDVFVSYKSEDRDRVARLVAAFEKDGVTVWLDVRTPAAEAYPHHIEQALHQAKCVVVVWSDESTTRGDGWVRDEANHAKRRGVMLPVRIDRVEPPLGFGDIQALDLVGWEGARKDLRYLDVLAAVRSFLDATERPVPQWPSRRRRRRFFASAAVIPLVLVGALVLSADARRQVCRVPGVRSACAAAGVGGVPTAREESRWQAALATGGGDGVRAYLAAYPTGAYAEEAKSRLAACRSIDRVQWRDQVNRLSLAVRQSATPFSSEEQAQEDARRRADAEAAVVCATLDGELFRVLSSGIGVAELSCRAVNGGVICGLDGEAICSVQARSTYAVEECGTSELPEIGAADSTAPGP